MQRYHILLARGKGTYHPIDASELGDEEAADLSRRILQAVRLEGWQIGKSRVFLRAGQLAQMEVSKTLMHLALGQLQGLWWAQLGRVQLQLPW